MLILFDALLLGFKYSSLNLCDLNYLHIVFIKIAIYEKNNFPFFPVSGSYYSFSE